METIPLTEDELMDDLAAARLAELDKITGGDYPMMQRGDITGEMIKRSKGVTRPAEYMAKIVRLSDDWEMLKAVDTPGSRRWFWVLRKKAPA